MKILMVKFYAAGISGMYRTVLRLLSIVLRTCRGWPTRQAPTTQSHYCDT
nr:MAG TPA: hypothetical protein [Caudoviricetes sp.]